MGTFIRYPDALVCRVTGKHASQYLQNRLTNDIRTLAPGKGCCEAAALSPQGRIMAIFTVASIAPDSFLLTSDGGTRTEVLHALSQFKVAERVDFTDISDSFALLHCDGVAVEHLKVAFAEITSLPEQKSFVVIGPSTLLSIPRFSPSGIHTVIPVERLRETIVALESFTRELSGAALTLARVTRNLPTFPQELNSDLLLSETGRSELISFTKGCYVGQEVVAKIDALGRAPRALVRFAADAEDGPIPGESILDADDSTARPLGRIITSVFDPAEEQMVGFAILRSDRVKSPGALMAGGHEMRLVA